VNRIADPGRDPLLEDVDNSGPSRNQLRILIVEDDPDHAAMILRRVSRAAGSLLAAERAASLAEAVAALSRPAWDAVLLDLQLPDSHGLDTLARIVGPAAGVPVIVLTSLGDEELGTRALQQGAQDYLVKDQITTELLSRTVRYAIERKRIEERLKISMAALAERAAELEQLNRRLREQNNDLDNFNHMISHDLREPIRHLRLFSQRLRGSAGAGLPEKSCRELQQIYSAANRMESSIAGLQVLSTAGRRDINRERVSLDSCLRSALADLEQPITEKEAVVSYGSLPGVVGDSALLTLLFRNLVSNAMKYCLARPAVHITAEQQGTQWIFGVSDNGIGVDPRYAERIFVPFQRLHGREEYGGGSGLGLAICQKIVERHGGRIWVDSGPGSGAHFQFTLSPREAHLQPAADSRPSAALV
jgi:signal transduction histidine kinase